MSGHRWRHTQGIGESRRQLGLVVAPFVQSFPVFGQGGLAGFRVDFFLKKAFQKLYHCILLVNWYQKCSKNNHQLQSLALKRTYFACYCTLWLFMLHRHNNFFVLFRPNIPPMYGPENLMIADGRYDH